MTGISQKIPVTDTEACSPTYKHVCDEKEKQAKQTSTDIFFPFFSEDLSRYIKCLRFKGFGALITFDSQEDVNITQHESICLSIHVFKLLSPTHSSGGPFLLSSAEVFEASTRTVTAL